MSKLAKEKSSVSSILYMTLWIFCAMGAVAYIAFLIENTSPNLNLSTAALQSDIKPERAETLLSEIRDGIGQTNQSLRQLNVKYYGLDKEISSLQKNVATLSESNTILNSRVKLIEQTIDPDKNWITGSVQKTEKTKVKALNNPDMDTLKSVHNALTANDVINQQNQNPNKLQPQILQTRSILSADKSKTNTADMEQLAMNQIIMDNMPIKKTDAAPSITRTQFAVSLGNYPDINRLKKAWSVLNKKYSNVLGNLQPRYITMVIDNNAQYQLVSGPINNALDAAKICFHLQQSKTYCKQTIYVGSNI